MLPIRVDKNWLNSQVRQVNHSCLHIFWIGCTLNARWLHQRSQLNQCQIKRSYPFSPKKTNDLILHTAKRRRPISDFSLDFGGYTYKHMHTTSEQMTYQTKFCCNMQISFTGFDQQTFLPRQRGVSVKLETLATCAKPTCGAVFRIN